MSTEIKQSAITPEVVGGVQGLKDMVAKGWELYDIYAEGQPIDDNDIVLGYDVVFVMRWNEDLRFLDQPRLTKEVTVTITDISGFGQLLVDLEYWGPTDLKIGDKVKDE